MDRLQSPLRASKFHRAFAITLESTLSRVTLVWLPESFQSVLQSLLLISFRSASKNNTSSTAESSPWSHIGVHLRVLSRVAPKCSRVYSEVHLEFLPAFTPSYIRIYSGGYFSRVTLEWLPELFQIVLQSLLLNSLCSASKMNTESTAESSP